MSISKPMSFIARYQIIIAMISLIAIPIVLNAEATNCKECTQKNLQSIVKRLIAFSNHSTKEFPNNEYSQLKNLILLPEMKLQINEMEAKADLLSAYAEYSEDRKLDLVDTTRAENYVKDHILLKPPFVKSKISLIDIKYQSNKAEVMMLRNVKGDDQGKVWKPYQEKITIYFECYDGRWMLQDVLFTDIEPPAASLTLRQYLSRKTSQQPVVLKEWRPRVEAAQSNFTRRDK